jgi:uncharacterized protein YdhG (YjbR/CyaY superfamily)
MAKKLKGRTAPTTIDEYLVTVSDKQRVVLTKLRKTIQAAAPKAAECISYGIPAFRHSGMLVGFSASKAHCSFFPMNGHTVEQFADELAGYSTSKGTIRFSPGQPLPAALVRKIVKARLAENTAREAERQKKT